MGSTVEKGRDKENIIQLGGKVIYLEPTKSILAETKSRTAKDMLRRVIYARLYCEETDN